MTPSKPSRATKLTDRNARRTAFLMSKGLRQKDIMDRLGVSQTVASRLMKRAESEGLVEVLCHLDAHEIRKLEHEFFGQPSWGELEAGTGDGFARIHAIHVVQGDVSDFALGAARLLLDEVLPGCRCVGVTWGFLLRGIVNAIGAISGASRVKSGSLTFIPMCGDPPQIRRRPEQGSSVLAAILDGEINGSENHPYSLGGVAAFIPSEFEPDEVRMIRRFFDRISSFGLIFGNRGRPGLVDEIDTLLTGVGTTHDMQNPIEDLTRRGGSEARFLQRCTLGNIGGVFLEKEGISAKDTKRLEHVREHWTGISLASVGACAERASSGPGRKGGVVVAAAGIEKAQIIRESIRRGLVNRLIVDQDLAAELADPADLAKQTTA